MHCHIMPGVDDGSRDIDMSRNMIDIAYGEGIDTVILTPHCKPGPDRVSPDDIRAFADRMTEETRDLGRPVSFYPGNEVLYYTDCIEELDQGRICTLVDSKYVLVEFEPMDDIERICTGVRALMYGGYRPVLAHIERYAVMIGSESNWRRVADMGCLIQVNTSSVIGDFGHKAKAYTKKLLKEHAVHFVATDAHSDRRRAPYMEKCAKYLRKKCGDTYADSLINTNVHRLIDGELL